MLGRIFCVKYPVVYIATKIRHTKKQDFRKTFTTVYYRASLPLKTYLSFYPQYKYHSVFAFLISLYQMCRQLSFLPDEAFKKRTFLESFVNPLMVAHMFAVLMGIDLKAITIP